MLLFRMLPWRHLSFCSGLGMAIGYVCCLIYLYKMTEKFLFTTVLWIDFMISSSQHVRYNPQQCPT